MFDLHPDTNNHDEKILDAMVAIAYWKDIHKSNGKKLDPADPLTEFANNFVKSYRRYQGESAQRFRQEKPFH